MKLTNKKVEQLITNTKSYIVWDSDVRGFGVRVNLNAKKNHNRERIQILVDLTIILFLQLNYFTIINFY